MSAALLTDAQLAELGRLKIGLWKIKEAIERINALAAETGLPLRAVQDFPLSAMANDISQLAFLHELAVGILRAQAMERLAA